MLPWNFQRNLKPMKVWITLKYLSLYNYFYVYKGFELFFEKKKGLKQIHWSLSYFAFKHQHVFCREKVVMHSDT